jgi:hypothetical protein
MTATANHDPEASELLGAADRLVQVMVRENEALRTFDRTQVKALLEDKDRASRSYATKMRALVARLAEQGPKADPDLKRVLKAAAERVERLTRENDRLLQAAIGAHKRMIEAVNEAVKAAHPGAGTYTAAGTVGRGAYGKAPPPAVALNRAL